jgi:hypothetical protein
LDQETAMRVISIISARGGVGKTMIAATCSPSWETPACAPRNAAAASGVDRSLTRIPASQRIRSTVSADCLLLFRAEFASRFPIHCQRSFAMSNGTGTVVERRILRRPEVEARIG